MNRRMRASVLECVSPLPPWNAGGGQQRQRPAALQDLADFVRLMEEQAAAKSGGRLRIMRDHGLMPEQGYPFLRCLPVSS